jgi:plastocyanin
MDRLLRAVFLLLSIVPVILAQYDDGGDSGSSSSSSSAASSAPSPASTASGVHEVDVGQNGFTFNPDTVNASTGDTVQFNFHPLNHSVVQSAFDKPCQPQQNGIFSGFMPVSSGQGVCI